MISSSQFRIYYEDTDVGGIVYHANYLKFCERARSDHFFNQGTSSQRGENHFVITAMDAKFKAPAKLGDLITVTVAVKSISKASFVLHQEVLRGDTLLFEMNGTFVLTNTQGKVIRLGEEDLKVFKA